MRSPFNKSHLENSLAAHIVLVYGVGRDYSVVAGLKMTNFDRMTAGIDVCLYRDVVSPPGEEYFSSSIK